MISGQPKMGKRQMNHQDSNPNKMPTQDTIQALIEARTAGLKEASETRDVDALMSWHSADATFVDKVNGISHRGIDAIHAFYTQAYAAMPTFRISEPNITGTPEFVAAEMRCEGETCVDLPHMGLKAGDTLRFVGVSLFWWRWEGEGAEWDGSLSDEAVRGWKIVEEHAYHNLAK
jgi:ketosteroid isomerase-like protein